MPQDTKFHIKYANCKN